MSKASRAQARWERSHKNTDNHKGWGDPRAIRRFWRKKARDCENANMPATADLYWKDARNG